MGEPVSNGQLRAMLDDNVIQVMTAYGDAACKGKEGPCGLMRMTREIATAIQQSSGGANQVGCDMKSNRLEFKYICPHTGKPMYRIHRNRPHEMSGACVFDKPNTVNENYTPVQANVTLDWKKKKAVWKVSQFSVMLGDKIVRVDAKGVKQEKIFR